VRTYGNNQVAGLILNITYGYNVRDCEDPLIGIADEATRNTVKAGGPGAMLCDMFPLCKLTIGRSHRSYVFWMWILITSSPVVKYLPAWFPFAQFKRHALFTRGLVLKMFDVPYQWVKEQVVCRYV